MSASWARTAASALTLASAISSISNSSNSNEIAMTSQYLRSTFSSLREYLTPITHKSTFATTSEITPDEFVEAGDYLVYRFPTWQWSPAEPSKAKDFLPAEKQFLVTRHVPCYVRAADYEYNDEEDDDNGEDEGNNNVEGNAVGSQKSKNSGAEVLSKEEDALDHEGWAAPRSTTSHPTPKIPHPVDDDADEIDERSIKEVSEDEDIDDIDDLIDENAEDVEFVDNKVSRKSPETSKKRSYDLYITYSTSYRVPKMYLVGFDSNSVPLTPEQMFEDIASDYRHKTVTIEKAPFLNSTTAVSIHPCKHATVMKVLMKRAAASARERSHSKDTEKIMKKISHLGLKDHKGDDSHAAEDGDDWEDLKGEGGDGDEGIRVDQYLVVFLKFISSVIPGIEHDYTMEAL